MANERLLLRDELIRDEGIRLRMYFDSRDIPTIGIGFNLKEGFTWSEVQAVYDIRIAALEHEVAHALPWFPRLDPVRKRVLLNMAYNLGVPRLLGFRKMLAAVERGDYEDAALEMLNSKWAEQVKARATRLAHMMRTGAVE